MIKIDLSTFVARFDLRDRSIDTVHKENQSVAFTFDLSHCDDPDRDDETKMFLLDAIFPASAVRATVGDLEQTNPVVDGEILEAKFDGKSLRLGIEWTDYEAKTNSWSEIEISASPERISESVIDRET